MTLRVRFAPSPTGYLHVGGLRTALYNYLLARKEGGRFLLRIEDTDQKRFVEGAVEALIESLRWGGVDYDEGPGKEGAVGPYIQSERLGLYQGYAKGLVEQGKAYYAFDTAEELEAMRKEKEEAGSSQRSYERETMKNSLSRSSAEVEAWLAEGKPHVIRLKSPADAERRYVIEDIVHGRIEFGADNVDDLVLLKADGYPTYHLASVIDDHEMGITHVIRGEEWLPSAPKHIILYEAFGWEPPKMAHLPLLLNPDGSKMSKRKIAQGIQLEVMVEAYREQGYLPEALINYLALLGWNPGTGQEIFTMAELIEAFSLERVQKAGASFDLEKLQWMNKQHLKLLAPEELAERLLPTLEAQGVSLIDGEDLTVQEKIAKVATVILLMRERVTFLHEIPQQAPYLFAEPAQYDEKTVQKRWKGEAVAQMKATQEAFAALASWERASLDEALESVAAALSIKKGGLMPLLRLVISGEAGGPDMLEMMVFLGQEVCLRRFEKAFAALPAA